MINRRQSLLAGIGAIVGAAVPASVKAAQTVDGVPLIIFRSQTIIANTEELLVDAPWLPYLEFSERQQVRAFLPKDRALKIVPLAEWPTHLFWGDVWFYRTRYIKMLSSAPLHPGIRFSDRSYLEKE
jgi:hypothetical protein